MLGFFCVGGDAFGAGDVDERLISNLVRLFGKPGDWWKLFRWIEKAFIAARDVIVYFDPKHVASLGVSDNRARIRGAEAVGANANIVGPVLPRLVAAKRRNEHIDYRQNDFQRLAHSGQTLEFEAHADLRVARRAERAG